MGVSRKSDSSRRYDLIHPRVKFGGISFPRYEMLNFAVAFSRLQYPIHVETLVVGFRHLLKLGLLESAFYKLAG